MAHRRIAASAASPPRRPPGAGRKVHHVHRHHPPNVIDLAAHRNDTPPTPLPLIDPAKAAKLRGIIKARANAEREVARLQAENAELRTAPVPAHDIRMRHIWIAAARAAQDEEYCDQYDMIASLVGGVTREELRDAGDLDRTYQVRTHITVEVNLLFEAADEDAALSRLDSLSWEAFQRQVREHASGLDDFDLQSWDTRSAELDD